ncbi:MAG: hypothetical protein GX660_08835 [Clostridiaceae bacterium]|nr:hypothetical protein [Clostridiaceae bacterium]
MKCRNERFVFEEAKHEDMAQILEILEESGFKGNISLLYTRRPDAYISFMYEGQEVSLAVCRDTQNDRIAGIGAVALRQVYVNGKPEKVGYLFALRVREEYRNVYKLVNRGYDYFSSCPAVKKASYFITTILEENEYAIKLLEKKRPFMPLYEFYQRYEVFTMTTRSKWTKYKNTKMTLKHAETSDIPMLVDFLNREGRKSQMFPVLDEINIKNTIVPGLSTESFYILLDGNGEITACALAWDQKDYKQYVVKGYGGILKALYPVSFLFNIFGYPSLPPVDSILKFFTLSFWAVRDNLPEIFSILLGAIAKQKKEYPFFIAGICEGHPLKQVLDNIPHISYSSRIYLVDWERLGGNVDRLDKNFLPYLECGML